MTLSYKKSKNRVNAGEYYIACQENVEGVRDGKRSVDDYYSGSAKEPPGVWYSGPDFNDNRTETRQCSAIASVSAQRRSARRR